MHYHFTHLHVLGERYEQREGVADMDYHMHLVERGGAEVNKKSFIRWRGNGIAFRVFEDNINEDDLQTNVTLLSGEGRSAGYWGDITSGPFMCHRE